MNYIIFDLEYNQLYNPLGNEDIFKNPKCPFEIIQIGAIKTSEKMIIENKFNKLIKPSIYPLLHPFVSKLTGIKEENLEDKDKFELVANEFIDFINNINTVFVVWGVDDIKELINNMSFHDIKFCEYPLKYIDLQSILSKKFNCSKGVNLGLKKAINLLSISETVDFHDAYNDAYYTFEIFRRIFTPNIKISYYNNNRRKPTLPKSKLDTNVLFNQIEKMYNRKLTNIDKSMIKTAYLMGKSNQFQVIVNKDKV